MTQLNKNPSLKEISALKKKITWGDVPTIFNMFTSSVSDIDGILTHGFDSAFKQLLNTNNWNLPLLGGFKNSLGKIQVQHKPMISLRHHYNDMGYELHCYPIINGQVVYKTVTNNPDNPFIHWYPETMQLLFRINSLIAFSIYSYQNGDEADIALIKYAYLCVERLISILSDSFDIMDITGYNIAEFYQEVANRKGNIIATDLLNSPAE